MALTINKFRGEYGFLSNFYNSEFLYSGIEWHSVEQAYQAFKCNYASDFRAIILLDDPVVCKRYSKTVVQVADFAEKKLGLMCELVYQKFMQNEELKNKLMNLPKDCQIIEGNDWGDTYWGVCSKTNTGKNNLGKILMQIKKDLEMVEY